MSGKGKCKDVIVAASEYDKKIDENHCNYIVHEVMKLDLNDGKERQTLGVASATCASGSMSTSGSTTALRNGITLESDEPMIDSLDGDAWML